MEKLTVLVCPMDWGLGHASRCVPVISAFLDAGCRVVVAAAGRGRLLIEREFGNGRSDARAGGGGGGGGPVFVDFPGFRVSWPRRYPLLKFAGRLPSFLLHIRRERRYLELLVKEFGVGIVVSDNRYGLIHPDVTAVIVTHQLSPSLPGAMRVFGRITAVWVRKMVSRFDECWIPDCPGGPTAGALAGGRERLGSVFFTGRLSRFGMAGEDPPAGAGLLAAEGGGTESYRVVFILSGPEPYRSLFEAKVRQIMGGREVRSLLVRGVPEGVPEDSPDEAGERTAAGGDPAGNAGREGEHGCREPGSGDGLHIVSFLPSDELKRVTVMAGLVVCRSGYSTVTDLLVAGKRALLVPTPGQTEQEYLGRWLDGRGGFRMVSQRELNWEGIEEMLDGGESGREATGGNGRGNGGCSRLHPGMGDSCNDGTLLKERVKAVIGKAMGSEAEHHEKGNHKSA